MELVGLSPFFGDLKVDHRQRWKLHPSLVSGVNPDGYRGKRVDPENREGSIRIASVGDSTTYGIGRFLPSTTYSGILSTKLTELGVPCETMNLGVPGHTVVLGMERLKRYLQDYELDYVTFRFGFNEGTLSRTGLPDANRELTGAPFWGNEFLMWFRTLRMIQFVRAQWSPIDPGRPPSPVRVPLSDFREKVIQSVALCRSKRIEPIWLEFVTVDLMKQVAPYNQTAREACKSVDATYIEFPALKAMGETAYLMNRLHPNGLGHEIIANTVLNVILKKLKERDISPKELPHESSSRFRKENQ